MTRYIVGGSRGSSYISGHFGCISPYFKNDVEATHLNSFHESGLYFTDTIMKSGDEFMPSPYDDGMITGHVGHGVCRITILHPGFCPSCNLYFSIRLFLSLTPLCFEIKT